MLYKVVFLVLILLTSSPSKSAIKLTVAFGNTLAPWVIADRNKGILIDLISEALEPLGYEIIKDYLPYARRIDSYKTKKVDVVFDINQNNIINSNLIGHFSGIIYTYENYAFSLKKRKYNFTEISQLGQYSFLSWQGAKKQLGSAYALMADRNPAYRETHNQRLQVRMLFAERVDVIQLDKQIYEFYRSNLIKENKIDANVEVDQFPLFGKNPNGFLFRSIKARDDFVEQIALMKKDGRFNKIFDKY